MSEKLILVSHHLCPYVQRAAISLAEKNVEFERSYVDLSNKPDWFLAISPLGKTPVLRVGDSSVFESAVILEYLEETQSNNLHPSDPLKRAEHRSWIEFSSAILNDIAGFYNAKDKDAFEKKIDDLVTKFSRLDERLVGTPWFDGNDFSLVDAAMGPVFRYFDVFDQIGSFVAMEESDNLTAWRQRLSERPSIRNAVPIDYEARLEEFLLRRNSYISRLIEAKRPASSLENDPGM
ncbi:MULTISPECIES: glutathione S-transferase family protein [Alphaproteobacteria]|uniref:glutathione S-transferase family protein n=1 Tax=Alphaproteobacteria TaxID=28211 RepID=UPI000C59F742|nr:MULTISPECIES: glutathione S-transferase family protein [Alphaproteobacteria]MAZ01733.1 glutathione S-transferase [Sneathiella sp.]MDF1805246.1 glutathione S-transferase family protein [Hyphomonas sp.]